jgi:hypothetical protein
MQAGSGVQNDGPGRAMAWFVVASLRLRLIFLRLVLGFAFECECEGAANGAMVRGMLEKDLCIDSFNGGWLVYGV